MDRVKKFLFQNTSTKQTIAKNTFWLFLSEVSGRLLKMILIIYAARVLGASGWGVFSYAISIGSLLMIFSDIGISGLITREVIQKKEGYLVFISTALLLRITILLISTLLVVLVSPSISHITEARVLFPIIAAILFFDSMKDLGFAINRASERMEMEMIVTIIMNIVILGFGILLLKIKLAPESIATAYAIGSATGFIVIAIIIKKDIKRLLSKIDRSMFKLVIQTTWPFAIITLVGSIMGNTDIFMLGLWKNSTEIGLYASVQRIQQFVLIIPAMIAIAAFPILSRLAHKEKKQFGIILEKTISLIMIIGVPTAIGGVLLSGQLIPMIFGSGYLGAIPIMRILMLMLLASFPLILLSNAIFAYNKQTNLALAYSSGVIANVILNLLLIPKFGAVGSAIATFISTTITTVIVWNKIKTINYFEVLPKLKKAFFATMVMIISIIMLKYLGINVILNIIISSVVYFCSLLLLKESIFVEIREIMNI